MFCFSIFNDQISGLVCRRRSVRCDGVSNDTRPGGSLGKAGTEPFISVASTSYIIAKKSTKLQAIGLRKNKNPRAGSVTMWPLYSTGP